MKLLLLSPAATLMFAADVPRAPEPAIPAKLITVHEGDTNTIYCAPLMDCSIHAPRGEKFNRRSIGDDKHFLDSPDEVFPSPVYTFKPAFPGFSTSLHLITDHDNDYSFKVLDPGKGISDFVVILRSGDPSIDKRIAGVASSVPRAEYELSEAKRIAAEAMAAQLRSEVNKKVDEASTQTAQQLEGKVQTYQFDRNEAKRRPWEISDIYRIGDFVYIRRSTDAQDLPTLTAVAANGKPEIITPKYDPARGLFKIAQRIDQGYFSFGGQKHEKRLAFHLPEGS